MRPTFSMADAPPQQQQEAKHSLFGAHEKKGPDPELASLRQEFNALTRRIREVEERYQNLRRKVQMTDQNIIGQNRKYMSELKVVNSDIMEIKHIINDLDNKMLLLIKELRMCARQEDLNVLEKYVAVWEPIRFVTRKEVERIMEDMIEPVIDKILARKLQEHFRR